MLVIEQKHFEKQKNDNNKTVVSTAAEMQCQYLQNNILEEKIILLAQTGEKLVLGLRHGNHCRWKLWNSFSQEES